jgi:hypothetical protein
MQRNGGKECNSRDCTQMKNTKAEVMKGISEDEHKAINDKTNHTQQCAAV